MPEIPEMETYLRYLQKYVVGKKIIEASVNRERTINLSPSEFQAALVGNTVTSVKRRGKYLLFELESGWYLLLHLMLDGRLYYSYPGEEEGKLPGKAQVELKFTDNSILSFCKLYLGYLKLLQPNEVQDIINKLGLEPLGMEYSWDNFAKTLARKKGMIKPFLMDQANLAGLGNAYSNESLFRAGILPVRSISSLSGEEREKLYRAIPEVLRDAINHGGDIEEPFAVWDSLSGGFNSHFMVYDRAGKACPVCGKSISVKEVGGRKAYYCSNCQN